MRQNFFAALLAILVVTALFMATPSTVSAHEQRTIAGKYDVEVGWDREPTYVGQVNAAAITIYQAGTQTPVEGVEKTLKVLIAFGGNEPQEFPLEAVYGKSGYYITTIIPSRAGSYIFTFVGSIENTPVNEKFESGPGRFEDAQPTDKLQFPPVSGVSDEIRTLRNEFSTLWIVAIVGVVAGVLGLLIGGAALLSKRNK